MLKSSIPVVFLCHYFCISRSGFYNWLNSNFTRLKEFRDKMYKKIKSIFHKSNETYGSPRIYREILKSGEFISENTVAKYMVDLGLDARLKKKFKIQTTDSNHSYPIAKRVFKTNDLESMPTRPYEVLAGDITYLKKLTGHHCYLAVVMDLYNREIIGWSIGENLKSDIVIDALKASFLNWDKDTKIIFHSDRGVQYASTAFRNLIEKNNVIPSMSRKGNCYDNAYVESFFATLKKEKMYRQKYTTTEEIKKAVFEYIETWYNTKRQHSRLDYLSPREFKEKYQ